MTLGQLILYLFIGSPQERAEWRVRAKAFCEKHLIADDPYDEQTRQSKLTDEQKEEIRKIAEKLKEEE